MTLDLVGFTIDVDPYGGGATLRCDTCRQDLSPLDGGGPPTAWDSMDLGSLVLAAQEHDRDVHTPPDITVEYVGPVVSRVLADQLMGTPEEQAHVQAYVDVAAKAVDQALASSGITLEDGPTSFDVMMERRRARQCRCTVVPIMEARVTATPADVAAAIEARRASGQRIGPARVWDPYRRSADA